MNQRKRRIFTIIIVIILAIVLILPMVVSVVPAQEQDSDSLQQVSTVSVSEEKDTAADEADGTDTGDVKSDAQADAGVADGVCAEGIYIEDIDVSGMSREEVQSAYEKKLEDLKDDPIMLYMGESGIEITAGELGLSCANPEVVDLAMIAGKRGNILRRFRADQYLEKNGSIVFALDLTFDEKEIRKALTGKQDDVNIDPIPVTMVVNDDQTVTAVDKTDGLKVQIEESAKEIRYALEHDWHGGLGGVELVSKVVPATGNISELSEVKDMIGSGVTSCAGSDEARVHNISLAAKAIDGTIIYPGEEFDFNQIVGETTEENGYEMAGAYEDGEIVESFGGGICQVSTTLYRAVLEAELEVTERYPHSMTVTYVQPSFDAAIADDVKNFCFVNDKDTPIYIHGTASDEYVTFEIYSKETRDPGRTLEFESRTVSETEFTTQFVYDSELPVGAISSTGGRYGLQTEAWKIIYQNGEKVDEVQVNDSEYIMSPLTYHIGSDGATDAWISEMDAAIATGDIEVVKSAAG